MTVNRLFEAISKPKKALSVEVPTSCSAYLGEGEVAEELMIGMGGEGPGLGFGCKRASVE
jgi:hypothetical protein